MLDNVDVHTEARIVAAGDEELLITLLGGRSSLLTKNKKQSFALSNARYVKNLISVL